MGYGALTKNNRLFWLGRYSERLFQGVRHTRWIMDEALDDEELDYRDNCRRLGIVDTFVNAEDYSYQYLFNKNIPESMINAADAMLGNGMVLRETISSTCLSYIQMAMNALEQASTSKSPGLELQWVLDDIFAFRGCCFDFIADDATINTVKVGINVERVSIMIRFKEKNTDLIRHECKKLITRLGNTSLDRDKEMLAQIQAFADDAEDQPDREQLLICAEGLISV